MKIMIIFLFLIESVALSDQNEILKKFDERNDALNSYYEGLKAQGADSGKNSEEIRRKTLDKAQENLKNAVESHKASVKIEFETESKRSFEAHFSKLSKKLNAVQDPKVRQELKDILEDAQKGKFTRLEKLRKTAQKPSPTPSAGGSSSKVTPAKAIPPKVTPLPKTPNPTRTEEVLDGSQVPKEIDFSRKGN